MMENITAYKMPSVDRMMFFPHRLNSGDLSPNRHINLNSYHAQILPAQELVKSEKRS
jgi:hypothetical protein